MKPAISAAALRVQAALGPGFEALEFDASTRAAADAAALGRGGRGLRREQG